MRGPAAVALAFLAGALILHEHTGLPGIVWSASLVTLLIVLVWWTRIRLLLPLACGYLWTACSAHAVIDARLPIALSGQDFEITGWIDSFPSNDATRSVFSFRIEQSLHADVPDRVRLSWYDAPATLRAGADYRFVVRLRTPRGLVNPGGFDYERWLFVERIGATGYVREAEPVEQPTGGFAQSVLLWRDGLSERIRQTVTGASGSALVMALAIGDRSGFTEAHWRAFRATGTSHLVAISGLHIGLVATLVFFLVSRLLRYFPPAVAAADIPVACAAAVAAALGYALLAGFTLPTQRACVMVIIALAALASRRASNPLSALAIALVAVLLIDPLSLLSASFWMSFAAVCILLGCVSMSRNRAASGRRPFDRLRLAIVTQFAMSFAMLPLTLGFFGEMSLIAGAVNLLAIPLFALLVVPAVMLSVMLVALSDATAVVLAWTGQMAGLCLDLIVWLGSFEWSLVTGLLPTRAAVIVAGIGALLALPWHRMPGRHFAWLALVPLVLASPQRPGRGEVSMLVLDVGHGLAVIVDTASRRLLYDAGPLSRSGFDAGGEIVVPALRHAGGRAPDLIVISHGDSDHAGGLAAVRESFPGVEVIEGPSGATSSAHTCVAGQRWNWDDVEFEMLHPAPDFTGSDNDSSCVLMIRTQSQSVLLTGDIERRAERALLSRVPIDADVVVVAHHGSATSSTASFVSAASADWAIVSAGHDNRWGFPVEEVRQRWSESGARMLVTADSGAIHIVSSENGMQVEKERQKQSRYWRTD